MYEPVVGEAIVMSSSTPLYAALTYPATNLCAGFGRIIQSPRARNLQRVNGTEPHFATAETSWRKMMVMRRFGLLNVIGIVAICGSSTKPAAACTCVRQSVEEAYSNAEVVFEGKIVSIDGATINSQWPAGRVKFKVSRVWKGNVRSDFEMPALLTGPGCLGFYPHHLKAGNELLVYARMASWTPTAAKGYFTSACARTALLKDAKQDLAALPNIVKQPAPKKPAQN